MSGAPHVSADAWRQRRRRVRELLRELGVDGIDRGDLDDVVRRFYAAGGGLHIRDVRRETAARVVAGRLLAAGVREADMPPALTARLAAARARAHWRVGA